MYKEPPKELNIPRIEAEILEFWEKNHIFEKSVESRDERRPFVFYEGPPTANGRPGIHHVLARTVKDTVCRLKTMQGYRVERKAGWDTHGLPVEIEVEKELGISTKQGIIEYGVDKFNARCRESVWRYKEEWDELTRRIGFWLDLEHPYITYENDYIESVWWILGELWKKNLLYQGYKILPYCPRCGTPLSSHEVALGYREVSDPSVFVRMRVKGESDTSFLVWTTTPWTLISNVALALHPDIDYVKIRRGDEYLILAESRLMVLDDEFEVVERFKGKDLASVEYEPLFQYIPPEKKAYYTITADFVTTDEGTGIVHIAPAFGEDDYQVGVKFDLPVLQPVDEAGRFTEEVTDFAGLFVKEADPRIIENLKERGLLYRSETYLHSYPHCWRCDSPLLYYARRSWYIRTTEYKDRMIYHNQRIRWVPPEVGEGRFGEWLENNVDWSLSRDRFWGTPLPIWICQECGKEEFVASIADLRKRTGIVEIADLHKPHIDEITFDCAECGGMMHRVPEVVDVWFDSGSMPVAQWHYPFENVERFEKSFPADFISEGVDQTRGWFYSLLAIAVMLFDKPAYKSCLSLELILDKQGQKMSKSRGNTVDPFAILDQHGADPLRWYLLTVSPPWTPTRFDPDGVVETLRKFYGTLLNTYSFFALYANVDGFRYHEDEPIAVEQRAEIDRWLLSVRNGLVEKVNRHLSRYDLTRAARSITDFVIDDVSNWYVRRCRRRFWKSELGHDKRAAYQTLYEVLETVSRLMAPMSPFIAEEVYRSLAADRNDLPESVHLSFFPDSKEPEYRFRDAGLEEQMDVVRRIVSLGRLLRTSSRIKVRQPLGRLIVVAKSQRLQEAISRMAYLIEEELNVKAIEFVDDPSRLTRKRAEPNFKRLGPRLGKLSKAAAERIRALSQEEISRLQDEGRLTLSVDGESVEITSEEVQIAAESIEYLIVEQEGELVVALDTRITEPLRLEGLAREFVNRVQRMRKEAGYDVVDRIKIYYHTSETLDKAIQQLADYIKTEALAERISRNSGRGEFSQEWEIDGEKAFIGIERIPSGK
jgi:isoleucyl-tRNA synthetase